MSFSEANERTMFNAITVRRAAAGAAREAGEKREGEQFDIWKAIVKGADQEISGLEEEFPGLKNHVRKHLLDQR